MLLSYTVLKHKSITKILGFFIGFSVRVIKLKKWFMHSGGSNVTIICLHKLGDSVFTIPCIKEIFRLRGSDISIISFEETKPIYELFFEEERIVTFQHSDFHLHDRFAKRSVRKRINRIGAGTIYDLTGSITSASLLFSSIAPEIIGFNEDYYKAIYTQFVPKRNRPHLLDRYLDTIQSFIPPKRDELKEFPVEVLKEGYILIHPFAGWKAKEWNFNKFIQLSINLNHSYKVVMVTSPNKITGDIYSEILTEGIEIVETLNIYELLKVIRNCSMIISNDSGPLYLANALKKPTFTIYGPTNPAFSLPYGKKHEYYRKIIKCSPTPENQYCFTDAGRNGCPSFECMNNISVRDVEQKVLAFIRRLNINQREITSES